MKTNKRFLALCLALLLVCAVLPAPTAQGADVQPVLSAALAHQAAAVPSPGYGDEWTVLGLARGGYFAVDSDYFARYYADVASKAPELTAASGKAGALNAYKSTDNSRVILALSAIGRDATQVGGCDLTAPYTDFAWVRNQGINGPVFALLALDSRNYLSGSAVRRQCVDAILAAELSGGGWAMNGAAETTRGTMAPGTPILVPTRALVKGMMAIIRMMKGRERPTLMIQPRMRLSHLWGQMPWGWVMLSSTPRGRPMT